MVGIGGIGMSALAQYLVHTGKRVEGSDREESPVTELLASKGIHIWIGHDGCNIPADTAALIYSDSIPTSNPERIRAHEMGIPEYSYFLSEKFFQFKYSKKSSLKILLENS